MSEDHHAPLAAAAPGSSPDGPLDRRIDELAQRIDTIAGAVATVAANQSALLEQNQQLLKATSGANEAQRQDLAAALTALATLSGAVERIDARLDAATTGTPDPAGVRPEDGATTESAVPQAAPSRPSSSGVATEGEPATTALDDLAESIARVEANVGALVDQPGRGASPAGPAAGSHPLLDASGEQSDALSDQVRALADLVPELVREVAELRAGVERLDIDRSLQATAVELRHHTDLALAGTIRVLDERFNGLRSSLVPTSGAGAGGMGFEVGAVMGAVQAAWSRLEQRLEHDFDELDRRLQALAEAVEAAANRPVVSGEQIRKTASSMKEAVVAAREQRRLRRGT